MSQVKGTAIDGDVAIGRHATIGGDTKVRGNTTIDKNLKVKGWLDAENIKGPNKGWFMTESDLRTAYPKPVAGSYASVGRGTSERYVVSNGEWVNTGSVITEGVDMSRYEAALSTVTELQEQLTSINIQLSMMQMNIGQPNGFVNLDGSGRIASVYLPSYVDDVIEFNGFDTDGRVSDWNERGYLYHDKPDYEHDTVRYSEDLGFFVALGYDECYALWDGCETYGEYDDDEFVIRPTVGKIYVDTYSNRTYRWSGSRFVEVGNQLTIGVTAQTAYAGSEGVKNRSRIIALEKAVAELQAAKVE